jgi:ribosomal-protein-serine acetyltransferase
MDQARHDPEPAPQASRAGRAGRAGRPAEELSRGDVTLRRWRAADASLAYRLVSESAEYLRPWLPFADGYTCDSAREYVEACERDWESGSAFNYLVASGGIPVGSAGLMARIGAGGLEIGYWVHPDHAGRGIATAAAGALTEAGFGLPGTDRVEIKHDMNNAASGQIPRKLGFARVATAPGEFPRAAADSGTTVIWRQVRSR